MKWFLKVELMYYSQGCHRMMANDGLSHTETRKGGRDGIHHKDVCGITRQ